MDIFLLIVAGLPGTPTGSVRSYDECTYSGYLVKDYE